MNPIRWQKPKWLPRFLAMPVPEPAQQASRILKMQRNIILPARVVVTIIVFYYLFYGEGLLVESDTWQIVGETVQRFFIFYIIFTAIAAAALILRRFPPRLVQWVVFAVGLVDGVLLAGLTLETNGFESTLFWVFPGLIVVNALSIPLATPQIVLNLSLSGFYLAAGLLYITVTESAVSIYSTPAFRHHSTPAKLAPSDLLDMKSLATKLKQPAPDDAISQYIVTHLSPETRALLAANGGLTNAALKQSLVDDLNRVVQNPFLYDAKRFAGIKLSPETTNMLAQLLAQKLVDADQLRLNRRLLQDAYPHEISSKKQFMLQEEKKSMTDQPVLESMVVENGTEPFILRLIILWLMTASCYGVQLLLFRERVSEEEERKSAARNDELKAAGRLAAEIAHQLKNPLGIINNAVFSLQRGLKEGKKDFSQQITIIREEIERSDRILTQLMGYAQLSEGRVEKLNIEEELDRAIAEVLPSGASYATQIHRDYGAALPALLMQRNHLSVVLVNLLQNAREALNGRGNINVSAHNGDNNTLQIVIGDDGPGIPFNKLDKIFEAYVTTKEKGTGLGLAIVKHNVELYGGAVRAESELGKGARFILLFRENLYRNRSMSANMPPVLVVDDEKNMRLSLRTVLSDEGYEVRAAESAEEALVMLGQEDFFMVITDARLGGMSGYELLGKVHTRWPQLPILMITAYATPKLAVEAIKAGAFDYLAKPFAPEELLHAVERCSERHHLLHQNAALRARANETYQLEQIVGDSPSVRELRQIIQTVAPTDARVLILGESGTGKELVAGALHCLSQRRQASYVRINCAAIPETLLESELFGHERGAFTGALKQKAGRVEEADGGSIFLDEIADMSRPLQAKLLRFLEDGTFTRVGGTQELRVDVRLIAATNRDIIEAIRENEFREDLFHRLNVVQFRLPPLRERHQDVLLLAHHFLKHFSPTVKKPAKKFSRSAQQKLLSHHWPGNVRELRNVIERALILETTDEIQPGNLPDFQIETGLRKATSAHKAVVGQSLDEMMANFERDLVTSVLEQNHFSLTRTAEQLKISRHALRYRMQRLNITTETDGDDEAGTAIKEGQS